MRYFKLLKDIQHPNKEACVKAGEILQYNGDDYKTYKWINNTNDTHSPFGIGEHLVESNFEWFEEVWKCEDCGKYVEKKSLINIEAIFNPRIKITCLDCYSLLAKAILVKETRQKVIIEKWLIQETDNKQYCIVEGDKKYIEDQIGFWTKIKKLSETEIEI